MDTFASYYPMYKLTPFKARILTSAVEQSKPSNILELGSFLGYSAIKMAQIMPSSTTITCIEGNPANVEVIKALLQYAFALQPSILARIRVMEGLSTNVIKSNTANLRPSLTLTHKNDENFQETFDFVFLDHDKDCYRTDLLLLDEKLLLPRNQSLTVVADNVVFPGAPGYLEAVGLNSSHDDSSIARSDSYIPIEEIPSFLKGTKEMGWVTRLIRCPFERQGFETKFQVVDDAMSLSVRSP
mmetsp:Transcript_6872/g.9488  ORF Transcript_6872/g.9488 Transcript_6872/m.9488 type:complete len:242 (-) Transcript_6872:13-738(-)